jgi:RNA polymerase sigma-70 factor (ECF subfamily)
VPPTRQPGPGGRAALPPGPPDLPSRPAGEPDLRGQALLRHRGLLYALARQQTRSPQEADDVVQETFLRALQGWPRQTPQQLRPWLVAICRNVVRSQHRRRRSRPAEALHPHPGAWLPSPQDTAEEAIALLTGAAVRAALRQLPAAQREAIVLTDLCGLTAARVAALLDTPRGTILARVHRGRRALAGLLPASVGGDRPQRRSTSVAA